MPYRDGDDPDATLLAELIARATDLPLAGGDVDAAKSDIERAERELGFALPSLLRRIYIEVSDGRIGPAHGIHRLRDAVQAYAQLREDEWPDRLLPLCEIGCGDHWYLDCRVDDGPVVFDMTRADGLGPLAFGNTDQTLRSWLRSWLEGVDVFGDMFEDRGRGLRLNPFTRKMEERPIRGKFKGPALAVIDEIS